MHFFRRSIVAGLAVLLAGAFLSALSVLWVLETSPGKTCSLGWGDPSLPDTAYIEIQIDSEHPVEPYFNGKVFVSVTNTDHNAPAHVEIRRSASGQYGSSLVRSDLTYVAQDRWLAMKAAQDVSLIRADGRTHRYFPFDSARFATDLTVTPLLPIRLVRVTNHAAGFKLDCATVAATRTSPEGVSIAFELRRSPLLQFVAVVLLGAAAILIYPIIRLSDGRALATSVASYFFSLWSIRAAFATQMMVFPTILDLAVLSLCTALPVALLLWLLGNSPKADDEGMD